MKRLLIIGLLALAGAAHATPEAGRLRLKLRRTESLRAYYRKSHGLSAWERRDIERRLKTLDARVTKEIRAKR